MRTIIILLAVILSFSLACKTKTPGGGCCSKTQPVAAGQTSGKVSHQYHASGCGTVILLNNADNESPQVLIPATALDKAFDKDGLVIKFNYNLLKMPMRQGCTIGMMAEITDVSK